MEEKPNTGNKESGGQAAYAEPVKPRRSRWKWLVDNVNRVIHERRAQREERDTKRQNEPPEQRAARLTAEATRSIARVTVVLALVGALSLVILYKQLYDTEQSSYADMRAHMPVVFPQALEPPLKPVEWISSKGGQPHIRLNLMLGNVGETQAISPVFEWGWEKNKPNSTTQFQSGWICSWKRSMWTKGVTVLDSQETTLPEAQELAKGEFYIYGVVKYRDGFHGKRDDHRVQWIIRVREFVVSPEDTHYGGLVASNWSCLDDQCDAYNNEPPYDPKTQECPN